MATNSPSATLTLVKGLLVLIQSRMPSILQAFDDFPAANQKLEFPALSIFTQEPLFVPREPYVIAKGAKIVLEGDPDIGKYPVDYVIGQWTFKMQLDFWCESKAQRHSILEEFVQAMNDVNPTSGVNLFLEDYYGEYAHLMFGKASFSEDSEISSQRNEWRYKVELTTNMRCVKRKMEYLMETVEHTTEATEGGIEDGSSGTGYTNGTI